MIFLLKLYDIKIKKYFSEYSFVKDTLMVEKMIF